MLRIVVSLMIRPPLEAAGRSLGELKCVRHGEPAKGFEPLPWALEKLKKMVGMAGFEPATP